MLIDYPLTYLTLTEAEYKNLLLPLLQTGFNSIGICSNFTRSFVYSIVYLQGLVVMNLDI